MEQYSWGIYFKSIFDLQGKQSLPSSLETVIAKKKKKNTVMGTYHFLYHIREAKFCLNKTQIKIITEEIFIIRVIIHHSVFY